jgi:hypothetical protein
MSIESLKREAELQERIKFVEGRIVQIDVEYYWGPLDHEKSVERVFLHRDLDILKAKYAVVFKQNHPTWEITRDLLKDLNTYVRFFTSDPPLNSTLLFENLDKLIAVCENYKFQLRNLENSSSGAGI